MNNIPKKLIFTRINGRLFALLYEGFELIKIYPDDTENDFLTGDIVIAKVVNVNKSIRGAFLLLSKRLRGFYAIKDDVPPVYIFKSDENSKKLNANDIILAKVKKEAHDNKPASLVSDISDRELKAFDLKNKDFDISSFDK